MKVLSKSVIIMILFDLLILTSLTTINMQKAIIKKSTTFCKNIPNCISTSNTFNDSLVKYYKLEV